jgi:hypothetical protein
MYAVGDRREDMGESLSFGTSQGAYFRTEEMVEGPNHCPTAFPSSTPKIAILWIEYVEE